MRDSDGFALGAICTLIAVLALWFAGFIGYRIGEMTVQKQAVDWGHAVGMDGATSFKWRPRCAEDINDDR